jgi:hypothetical protein
MNESNEYEKLWKKIPVDIFITHIVPYTYQKIEPSLLNDIRNFNCDYKMIINYYYYDLNEYCLISDIILFCNNSMPLSYRVDATFLYILNRSIMYNNLSPDKKYKYIEDKFIYNLTTRTELKIKFLLSLLTERERTAFINDYILQYYE